MPTRNVSLTREQDEFVERLVGSGEYQNASEAIRDGLRALQQRRREDSARVKALRAALSEGLAELDRGDHVELDTGELSAFVQGLRPAAARRTRPSNARTSRR